MKLRKLLVGLLIAELALAAVLLAPRRGAEAQAGIEERHFLTLVVRAPDGSVEERTFETRSFVLPGWFAARALGYWKVNRQSCLSIGDYAPMYDSAGEFTNQSYSPLTTLHDDNVAYAPVLLAVVGAGTSADGGKTYGGPLLATAVPSVSYVYNDVWFNVTVSATFSFSSAVTVTEAAIMGKIEEYMGWYAIFVYDSFPPVEVPAGGALAVVWTFAWKDYGAFTENWGKLWLYALTMEASEAEPIPALNFTDESGAEVTIPWPPWWSSEYRDEWEYRSVFLAWGSGSSSMSRGWTRLENELGSAVAAYQLKGSGLALGGVVGATASEVGLYWYVKDVNGVDRRILLMRWVPPAPLPAGTPVNVYVARGG